MPHTAYRVKIMPRAQRDLSGLYDWIGARASNAALAWYRGLKDAIVLFETIPTAAP